MSYGSKRTLTSMVAGVVVMAGYVIYALSDSAPNGDDLSGWARAILVFIGCGVGLVVIAQVVFHIGLAATQAIRDRKNTRAGGATPERSLAAEMVEDERDRLISRRSARAGQMLAGLGLMATLTVWALGSSIVTGLHVLLGAFAASSLLEGGMGVFFYERGLGNG